jgi:hypothetical protein
VIAIPMPVTITHNSHTHDRLTHDIVSKLWNLCNVFKDDGVTYHQYVTEPHLSAPVTLTKLVSEIDKLDWYSARQEGLGDLYKDLLQKNAEEKTSGAGQSFTPRPLIDAMLAVKDPGDEPASALLERLAAKKWAARQAEAAAAGPSRRGRRPAAANPAPSPVDAAPVTPDRLANLLRECGALSERALLAASELDPASFQTQLAHERSLGAIGNADDDDQELLEAVG